MLIKFNSPRLLGFNDKLIMPGINDLEADLVAAMLEDPILAQKIEDGELEILDKSDLGAKKVKSKTGGAPSGVDLLLASADKSALMAVKSTVAMPILEEWLSREKRVPVKKALREQIAKIKNVEFRDEKSKQKFEDKTSDSDEE